MLKKIECILRVENWKTPWRPCANRAFRRDHHPLQGFGKER